jgi:hypothetical protein
MNKRRKDWEELIYLLSMPKKEQNLLEKEKEKKLKIKFGLIMRPKKRLKKVL